MLDRFRASRIPAGWVWRFALAVLITAVAVAAFRSGVGVSAREGVEAAGLATQLYYAIGLFVLGGLDLGLPTGGPAWANTMLWGAYFVAPALTAGALAEALLRVWNPTWWRLRGLKDHVAVVGMGQIGTLYLEGMRRTDPKRRVLVVDRKANNVNAVNAQTRHRAVFLNGDIGTQATRDAMRLDRAAGVVLTTGSDLVNLEASTDILREHPRLAGRVVSHVADVAMERTIAGLNSGPLDPEVTAPKASGHTLSRQMLFNGHRIAADEMVKRRLSPRFHATAFPDMVVIAGFGRFGQTILELLQSHSAGEFSTVLIIDRVAHLRRRQFEQHVGVQGDYRLETLEANMADPETWTKVNQILSEAAPDPQQRSAIFILGTDDDPLNLRTAMTLRRLSKNDYIVVRCFSDSSLTRQFSREGDFEVFGVSSLLRDALGQRHEDWFGGSDSR